MLDDVLATLAACAEIKGTLVMSPERDQVPAGVPVLADPATGMNGALGQALADLAARGATRVAVIAADLPLLQPGEVASLVSAARRTGIALAPDARESGTNAVCLTLPSTFGFRFGPGSFALHREAAARSGAPAAIVIAPGLGFDVDEPPDLAVLRGRGLSRYRFLD
jgi:2-phospho-L-lactate guanylyltransferase